MAPSSVLQHVKCNIALPFSGTNSYTILVGRFGAVYLSFGETCCLLHLSNCSTIFNLPVTKTQQLNLFAINGTI